ncbi:MAG: long-chain fatty acid--CoA ligase [Ruminococcaceae bacterium]|nr:long-chain fatty acid--CoA ligase [Oscillospiraceae bacterium]
MKATEKKPTEVKIHKKQKTARKYERVDHVVDFLRVIEKHGDKIAYSYFDSKRNVKDLSYTRLVRRVRRMAAGLTDLGYAGKRIAIIGETSVAWLVTYLAVLATGGVAIPLDKELEINVIEGFLDQVDADGILYSGSFNGKFKDTMESHKSLKLFMPVAPNDAELEGNGVVPYKQILEKGKNIIAEKGYEFPPVKNREGLAEMLFTSGTTGTSKCVMLSQKNIFSCVSAACASVDFNADDTIVSLLPIHHTYELACTLAAMDYGIHICINDSLTHVLKNFKIFKPNALVLVPLYVYTFYKRIWTEAKKSGRDKKLKVGLGISKAMTTVGFDKRRDLFKDVLSAFGGNLEKIICGGAALNPKMIEFFEALGISIYEGFGITECSPLVFVTPYYARKYGSVGPTVPCCQARIDGERINEKGYLEGEIQVKGDNVMLGYYNNEEATRDAFTDDGWFRTGDVGYEDADGYFYITGRMKSVIVLENGKNVFPEEIEEYLEGIDKIAESAVIGRQNGENVLLVALVYPDFTKYPEDTANNVIQKDIERRIMTMNKNLPTYKQVKAVEIRSTPFEKTSSRKIKRHLLK